MEDNYPQFVQYANEAEQWAEKFIKRTRNFLPTIGRVCLVSTFIEDGIRMWTQWDSQRDFIIYHWDSPRFLAILFVLYNLIAQLGGASMVIVRRHVRYSCAILVSVIFIQTLMYHVLWGVRFYCRNLSLAGGLALLVAETYDTGRKALFAGLPTLETYKTEVNSYIQLYGRVTLILMFLTTLHWELSIFNVLESIFACALVFAVTIGWKTRLSAFALAVYLFIMNLLINQFWTIDSNQFLHDLYKYDFFLTLSIVGGLLMLISIGPGKMSIDHKRRNQ